jgi:hypothetical protein
VFGFDASRDKFHTGVSHLREKSLSIFVDERHIAQVDHCARPGALHALPTGAEFSHPRPCQLAAECPLLPGIGFRVGDA